MRSVKGGRDADLEIEEHCEEAEEPGHCGETKYEEGFPPDSFYDQALDTGEKKYMYKMIRT